MFEKLKQRRLEKEHDANVMLCLEDVEWVPIINEKSGEQKYSWDYWLRCKKCGKCLGSLVPNRIEGNLEYCTRIGGGVDRYLAWYNKATIPQEALDRFRELLLEKFPDADELTPERLEYLKEQERLQAKRDAYFDRLEEQRRKALEALPHCPNCRSVKIQPIKMTKRVIDTQLFGLASDTIGKSYECLDCKYKW